MKFKNIEDVQRQIKLIEDTKGDDEMAHSFEDELYIETLKLIAEGGANPIKLAKMALTAKAIDFARWRA